MSITKRDLAILSAHTGVLIGDIIEYKRYLDEILSEGSLDGVEELDDIDKVIKVKSKKDFLEVEGKLNYLSIIRTDYSQDISLLESANEEIDYVLNSNKSDEVKIQYLKNASRFINKVIGNLSEEG